MSPSGIYGPICLLLTVALLTACASTPRVDVARAPSADFSVYRTFSFHEPLGTDRPEGTSTILSQSLQQATRGELESRGYRFVDSGADLQVNFFVETKEVIEGLRRPDVGFGYGVFHRHYGVWSDYGSEVRQFTEGTLHVDVIDAGRDELVWEGVARSRESDGQFEFDAERLQRTVARVFSKFPSRPAN